MINSKTRLMGLLGNPLGHSLSPQINNHIAKIAGVNIAYLCFETPRSQLKNNISALKQLGAHGFNVTIPYKTDMLKYMDHIDPQASKINAVNTVKITDNGLRGHNTDVSGFIRAFEFDTKTILKDKKVIVIGAGGASGAIISSVVNSHPHRLHILNRTVKKAQASSDLFGADGFASLDDLSSKLLIEADVIINTTSAGMHPYSDNDPLCFFDSYRSGQIIYDIIYNPPETKLIKKAKKAGASIHNGLSMLIFQAIKSFEIINDIKIQADDINDIVKYLKDKYLGDN